MNRLLSLCLIWMCQLAVYAQYDGDYDPQSPPNPNECFNVILSCEPAGSGSFSWTNDTTKVAVGTECSIKANSNRNYTFRRWHVDGKDVDDGRTIHFTMPAADKHLVAVFDYTPTDPNNPEEIKKSKYNVTLSCEPEGACTFKWIQVSYGSIDNWVGGIKEVAVGNWCYISTNANAGFIFRGWRVDGLDTNDGETIQFAMPAADKNIVALFDYNPVSPENPSKNYWNPETGEVIIDDFTPGGLKSAIDAVSGMVKKITVAGIINRYDWISLYYYKNCTSLDLSRTSGLTSVPINDEKRNDALQEIGLPSTINYIGSNAFKLCKALSKITCYALTPPTIGNNAFNGILDSVVYVPVSALELYKEAEGWKDFTILPIQDEVSTMEVNLPEGADPSIYKNMYIELINTKSGHRQRYVITNRTTYSFNALIRNTQYNVYLKDSQGREMGRIENVDVKDEDVSVTFESLLVPHDLMLKVLTPTGEDVTAQTTIIWMDESGEYLTKGNTLLGQLEGTKTKFRVSLPQELGMLYLLPKDSLYEVQSESTISLTLAPIPQTIIGGLVRDVKTGQPLRDVTISVSQLLNGLYSKTFITKTDRQGQWSLQVYEAKTDITASIDNYLSQSLSLEMLTAEIPTFDLKEICGSTITLSLTYMNTDGETQAYYSDYANVAYKVFDKTTGKEYVLANERYPQIELMELLPSGTELRVVAESKNQKFISVEANATIDDSGSASITLPIKQLGGISASFDQTDNMSVVGILYDADGHLIRSYEYNSAKLTIDELEDGDYTLVTMGKNDLYNSIALLSQFPAYDLRNGVEYVKNNITVCSGTMTPVSNPFVPYFNDAKSFYIDDQTSFLINKSQTISGQYLTLNSKIEFKSDNVSDVRLIVDLPDHCTLVENSIMVGRKTRHDYTYSDNKLIIPLSDYSESVRFCLIPTKNGTYTATASVKFQLDGRILIQPIGSACYAVKEIINVPSIVSSNRIPVNGTTVGHSKVEIYDNGVLIGKTRSLENGYWSVNCVLKNAYNLSHHKIKAVITSNSDVSFVTETETKECLYDVNSVQAKSVTMINTAHIDERNELKEWILHDFVTVFDFQNPGATTKSYRYWPKYPDFTFIADLTNNDTTVVKSVNINVFTRDNGVRSLPAKYDAKQDRWVAVGQFPNSKSIPVNVSVNVYSSLPAVLDTVYSQQIITDYQESINAYNIQEIDSLINVLDRLIDLEEITEEIENKIDSLELLAGIDDVSIKLNKQDSLFIDSLVNAETEEEFNRIWVNVTKHYKVEKSFDEWQEIKRLNTTTYRDNNSFNAPTVTYVRNGDTEVSEIGIDSEILSKSWFVDEKELENLDKKVVFNNPETGDKIIIDLSPMLPDVGTTRDDFREFMNRVDQIYNDYSLLVDQSLGTMEAWYGEYVEHLKKQKRLLREARELIAKLPGQEEPIKRMNKRLASCRKNIAHAERVHKGLKAVGNCTEWAFAGYQTYSDLNKGFSSYDRWEKLVGDLYTLCNHEEAEYLEAIARDYQKLDRNKNVFIGVANAGVAVGTAAGFTFAPATLGTSLFITLCSGVASVGVGALATHFERDNERYWNYVINRINNNIDCKPYPYTDDPTAPLTSPTIPTDDPSGFVYEGVSSNRVEGVTATAFYKETVEDMYGDLHEKVVLWDAAEYAQENPLFTDENGMYAWDVPQGLWQVKFEKEGYQTTYSEWLPVPPPQLDVNIPMMQLIQPSVMKAKAFAEGVDVEFDKYMDPATLTTENIILTRNGKKVDGNIRLLNEEVAYEDDSKTTSAQTYASKMRLVVPEGEELLSTDEVLLTVSRRVKSYAGITMEQDYVQAFDVEPRIEKISVDSLIQVKYGGQRALTVAALPADASKGKKLLVKPLSKMIATASANEVTPDENGEMELTLDENGQAELVVNGELPGMTVMNFRVNDADVKGQTIVNVKDESQMVAVAPRASRVSGTMVYRGTQIRLSSETREAVIYYTLDGSCPCNSETRIKYDDDAPIIIADDEVQIKAMAAAKDLEESEVVEFNYSIKNTTVGLNMAEGWTWISHNVDEAVPVSTLGNGVSRVVSQTKESINDPVAGLVGNLKLLQPTEGYKVKTNATAESRLTGFEFNARDNNVPLEIGWNWIGYPVNQTMTLKEAFEFYDAAEGDYIVGQDGFAEFVDGEWHGTLEGMVLGKGYLYKSAVSSEIPFNTRIVSVAGSRIGKRNLLMNSPWSYDKHAYPDVMPVTASLYHNGAMTTDYVVGAFVNGECRGVGQWQDNKLLMSVYGQPGEKVSFVAADAKNAHYYTIDETLVFTTDNQGSWRLPMSLTIGGETTGLKKLYKALTVSPTVFTDHIEVSADGQTMSRLTLTNMSGQQILALNDLGQKAVVTTGQLPAGVYVLAVVADGKTYYKKVMKKSSATK